MSRKAEEEQKSRGRCSKRLSTVHGDNPFTGINKLLLLPSHHLSKTNVHSQIQNIVIQILAAILIFAVGRVDVEEHQMALSEHNEEYYPPSIFVSFPPSSSILLLRRRL